MSKYLILLGLLPAAALAATDYPRDITLNWTNPSEYVDGSPIEAGDLDAIRVECYRGNDTVPTFTSTVPDNGEGLLQSETYVNAIPSPGTYSCVAYAIVIDGTESDASNSTLRKYIGKPMPPQTFN